MTFIDYFNVNQHVAAAGELFYLTKLRQYVNDKDIEDDSRPSRNFDRTIALIVEEKLRNFSFQPVDAKVFNILFILENSIINDTTNLSLMY